MNKGAWINLGLCIALLVISVLAISVKANARAAPLATWELNPPSLQGIETAYIIIFHPGGGTSAFAARPDSVKPSASGIGFTTTGGVALLFVGVGYGISTESLKHFQAPVLSEFDDDAPDPDGNVYPLPEGVAPPTGERYY